jgi:hypothetical protein
MIGLGSAEAVWPEDWQALRERLAEHHAGNDQRMMLADQAIREVMEGVQRLEALGHRFMLVEKTAVKPVEYPKMLYSGSGTMTVDTLQQETAARAAGWREHPSLEQEA